MMNQPARETFDSGVPQPFNPTAPDRCSEIRRMLLDVMAQGPWRLENRIDALTLLRDVNDSEAQVVQQIYQICYETAERDADENRMWRYQRLLRAMMLQRTVTSTGTHPRPDPLTSLDPQNEFSLETEAPFAPPGERLIAEPQEDTPKRTLPIYDAVFPAVLFGGALVACLLTLPSSAIDERSASPTQLPAMSSPSNSKVQAAVPVRQEHTLDNPSELQIVEAAAATETASGAATKPIVASTAAQSPSTPKLVAPAKPSAESSPAGRDETASRSSGPARRTLGPAVAVQELEAQLEAMKGQAHRESAGGAPAIPGE